MMIELDHRARRRRSGCWRLAEARGYSGVIASHSWSDPHMWSRIYRLGGFAEPITSGAESFIEEWRQLRAAADPRFKFGIGFGADSNGFHAQPGPRGADQPNAVTYPFKSLDGRISFDRRSPASASTTSTSTASPSTGCTPTGWSSSAYSPASRSPTT